MPKTPETTVESAPTATPAVAEEATLPPTLATSLASTLTPQGAIDLVEQVAGLNSRLASEPAATPASSADVNDEIAGAGPSFGTFLKGVGMAVADTQTALDKSMVATAQALSKEKVKVAAVFEQVVKDDGELDNGVIHFQEVPLITLVSPTSLQFTQVHLTADMDVEEFTTDNAITIKKKHTDVNVNAKANYGLGGFGASGGFAVNHSSDELNVGTRTATDKAAGKLHMEATIEPRTIELPKPFVVQKGPKLRLLLEKREDLDAEGAITQDAAAVKSRRVTVKALLVARDGSKLADGKLSVNCEGGFAFTTTPAGQTDTNGEMTIVVTRTGITPETAGLQETSVHASMNLVTASIQFGI